MITDQAMMGTVMETSALNPHSRPDGIEIHIGHGTENGK